MSQQQQYSPVALSVNTLSSTGSISLSRPSSSSSSHNASSPPSSARAAAAGGGKANPNGSGSSSNGKIMNPTILTNSSSGEDGPIHKFISIIGTPPPPSDQRETPNRSILPAINPQETIDVLDANDEDPFTLETFQSMLTLHSEKNMDFIIARVTTVDPEDEKRFYYSYYAAHHINKVLFRTQPEEGLLHRMRAKNPLNNMTIIGDVHYYVVKPIKNTQAKISAHSSAATSQPPKSPMETILSLVYPSNSTLPATPESPGTKRAREIREHFKEKTNMPPEGQQGMFGKLLGIRGGGGGSTSAGGHQPPLTFLIRQEAYENDLELQDRAMIANGKRNSFDDAYSDLAANLRPTSNSRLIILAKNEPQRHRNVRSVAFANERTNSMTIEDWVRLKNDPSPDAIVMSASTRIVIDESPTRKRHARSPKASAADVKFGEPLTNTFYKAHYYASDDDYLMHPSVRSFFKANALEDHDHVLFTIQTQTDNGGEAHPTLANLSLFLGDEETRAQTVFRKNLKWIIVVYALVSFVIIKWAIPTTYQYVAGFFLFFIFALFLIISL